MKQDRLYQLVFEAIIIGFITIKKVFFFFFLSHFPGNVMEQFVLLDISTSGS